MISVIIPTYNRCDMLKGAIRSVLEQRGVDLELLVVDDGSTDDTRKIVEEIGKQSAVPVRYIFQENAGAAAARNTGIRCAVFDVISFLDSDDRFLADKLRIQSAEMDSSRQRISHTREIWFRRGNLLNQKKKHQPPDGDIFAPSLKMCMVGMSTVMIRSSVFDDFGLFDESLPCCEDYDFWLRVAAKEEFLLVDKPLVRKNGGRDDQLSVRYRQGMDKYRIRSLVKLLDSGLLDRSRFKLALEELERKCLIYGNGCLKHGRSDEGRVILQLPQRYTMS